MRNSRSSAERIQDMWGQPPSAVRRRTDDGRQRPLPSCSFGPPELPLVRPHIHPPPPKSHSLGLQAEPLLNSRIPGKFDLAACAQYPLPGQSKSAPQGRRHPPCRPRKSRRPRYPSIGRDLPARNRAYRLLNPQTHHTRILLLGFSCRRPAAFLSHVAIHTKDSN
jgi:hypothetical protein